MTHDPTEETIRHIVASSDQSGDFVMGDDGFVVFWPEVQRGAFEAWHLRVLADELDKRNAPWMAQIDHDFAGDGR